MKGLYHIASVGQTPVKLHWLTLALPLGALAFTYSNDFTTKGIIWVQLFIIAALVSVFLHELGHVLTANKFHVKAKDILILPIGGAARLEGIPRKSLQEGLIALAGPLINLLIAILLSPILWLYPSTEWIPWLNNYNWISFTASLCLFNFGVYAFNLLPAFPLDGGRFFRSLLSLKISRLNATRTIAYLAMAIGSILILLSFLGYNLFFAALGIYFIYSAINELRQIKIFTFLNKKSFKEVSLPVMAYHATTTVEELREALRRSGHQGAAIVDDCCPIGLIKKKQLDALNKDDIAGNLEMSSVMCFNGDVKINVLLKLFKEHPNCIAIEEIDHRPAGFICIHSLEKQFHKFLKGK